LPGERVRVPELFGKQATVIVNCFSKKNGMFGLVRAVRATCRTRTSLRAIEIIAKIRTVDGSVKRISMPFYPPLTQANTNIRRKPLSLRPI